MTSKRVLGAVLTGAVVAGYAGAAAWSAWAAPTIEEATGFGPGDGLTRYALTAQAGVAGDLLGALEAVPGVASAQWVGGGRALVAVGGVTPERLRAVPGVADVELSPSVPVLGTVTDPFFPQYGWNLENTGSNAYLQTAVADADVDATAGWDSGTGAGRVVAVVDTGFDSDHPDLAGSLWTNPDEPCGTADTDGNGLAGDCHGWNFYADNADVDNGAMGTHGTSVAGVIGARAGNGAGSAGVAPDVRIMPLVAGGGETVDVYLCALAIRYAVDHGADVVNASWGGPFSGPALDELRSAIAYAEAHDVLVVAAAGNDSADRDTTPMYPASLTEANVVTVGSSTAADTLAGHSAYGAASVDLFAPGYKVATTSNDGGLRLVDGTSVAAPHVAAAVALYRAALPGASAAELKAALLADVDSVPAFVGRSVTGGRLTLSRVGNALAGAPRYAFTSMTAPPGTVTPAIGVSGSAGPGRYSVAIGLGMEHAGEIWALSQKPVTLHGVTVPTDDAGDAVFDLGALDDFDGIGLSPAVELGDGRYVLAVQLYRDGEPLGRTHAAPLLVSATGTTPDAPAPDPAPDGSTPDGTTPDGTTPGGSSPGGTAPGGTTPPPTTGSPGLPGTTPGTTPDGGSTPDGTTPDGTAPEGGTPEEVAPEGSTPDGTAPEDSTPDGTSPGGTSPGSTTPGGTTPDGTTPGSTTPDGGTPGTTTYPEVGVFRITSLSPNLVGTDGGTLVTITGRALPADPTVRIGATTTAAVVHGDSGSVVFRVPARVAGVYDVSVYAPDGRSTVLSNALTYAEEVAPAPEAPSGTAPDGTSPEGTTPDGTAPEPTTPGGSTTPGAPAPGGTTPGGPAPDSGPVVREGPAGERLVRSDRFRALSSIWSVDCASSCTGVAL
ncbi:IPT/TIG domain-containing protein [Blastococcus sp. DSM 46786]|uniref:S8 family serine peptidase n=1 Tax=Blastococcus sp. DSM 46786 TaxID=1798227 RepID=UPI0008BED789|nr:S8 family serine peptidase [Blastococcus sp. DSM 46786]SEK89516.1 IPT/TIG domain-containing protein [Blastococcus sp. DSM 46786]